MTNTKSDWDRFFDDTEDIQCVSCLDACVLEYFIDDCCVQVNRISDNRFSVNIQGFDEKGQTIYGYHEQDKAWKEKNIYNQAIYKKFVSGYFFHD